MRIASIPGWNVRCKLLLLMALLPTVCLATETAQGPEKVRPLDLGPAGVEPTDAPVSGDRGSRDAILPDGRPPLTPELGGGSDSAPQGPPPSGPPRGYGPPPPPLFAAESWYIGPGDVSGTATNLSMGFLSVASGRRFTFGRTMLSLRPQFQTAAPMRSRPVGVTNCSSTGISGWRWGRSTRRRIRCAGSAKSGRRSDEGWSSTWAPTETWPRACSCAGGSGFKWVVSAGCTTRVDSALFLSDFDEQLSDQSWRPTY